MIQKSIFIANIFCAVMLLTTSAQAMKRAREDDNSTLQQEKSAEIIPHFDSIPNDIMPLIFFEISIADILSASMVSKRFRTFSQASAPGLFAWGKVIEEISQPIDLTSFEESAQRFSKMYLAKKTRLQRKINTAIKENSSEGELSAEEKASHPFFKRLQVIKARNETYKLDFSLMQNYTTLTLHLPDEAKLLEEKLKADPKIYAMAMLNPIPKDAPQKIVMPALNAFTLFAHSHILAHLYLSDEYLPEIKEEIIACLMRRRDRQRHVWIILGRISEIDNVKEMHRSNRREFDFQLRTYDAILVPDLKNPLTHYGKAAKMNALAGNFKRVLEITDLAQKLHARTTWQLVKLEGDANASLKNYAEAIKKYEQGLGLPDSPQNKMKGKIAMCYMKLNQPQSAYNLFTEVFNARPSEVANSSSETPVPSLTFRPLQAAFLVAMELKEEAQAKKFCHAIEPYYYDRLDEPSILLMLDLLIADNQIKKILQLTDGKEDLLSQKQLEAIAFMLVTRVDHIYSDSESAAYWLQKAFLADEEKSLDKNTYDLGAYVFYRDQAWDKACNAFDILLSKDHNLSIETYGQATIANVFAGRYERARTLFNSTKSRDTKHKLGNDFLAMEDLLKAYDYKAQKNWHAAARHFAQTIRLLSDEKDDFDSLLTPNHYYETLLCYLKDGNADSALALIEGNDYLEHHYKDVMPFLISMAYLMKGDITKGMNLFLSWIDLNEDLYEGFFAIVKQVSPIIDQEFTDANNQAFSAWWQRQQDLMRDNKNI